LLVNVDIRCCYFYFSAAQINKTWEEQKAKKQIEQTTAEPEETIRNVKGIRVVLKYVHCICCKTKLFIPFNS
jgi:hypothetical protein